jgi:hypothetical protein
MSLLAKRLTWFAAGFAVFVGFTATIAYSVTYKPYGVSDSRRGEYEAAVSRINQRKQLAEDLAGESVPKAVVPERIHHFGMLDPHATASHAFTIGNAGESALKLSVRETSCKCTVGDLKQNMLLPGESTEVKLVWNTGYQADKYEQTATVVTNDPLQPTIDLKVTGEVRATFLAPESITFQKTDLGERATATMTVYSQLWEDFTIETVSSSDLPELEWVAEPADMRAPRLAAETPRSAWDIRLSVLAEDYGDYEGSLKLVVQPTSGDDPVTNEISCKGYVRSPITFYSPKIHRSEGLDLGTMVAGQEYVEYLTVRVRGDKSRRVEVLDSKPDQLKTTLLPTKNEGVYRLAIRVPKDCEMVTFNSDSRHGYVQVGDPENPNFSHWFPVYGAVVELSQSTY